MVGCQNYDRLWSTLNIRCRMKIGIQKGAIDLTTTHMACRIHRVHEVRANSTTKRLEHKCCTPARLTYVDVASWQVLLPTLDLRHLRMARETVTGPNFLGSPVTIL